MKLYYEEKDNRIEIKVEGSKSCFVAKSGDNFRFKLLYKNQTLFWANICSYYDGVWYINGDNEDFFPHISSQDIELISIKDDIQLAWQKYFIERLKSIEFFDNSLYHMEYYTWEKHYFVSTSSGPIYDFTKTFDFDRCRFLDWYGEDNGMILNTKSEKEKDSGRIKWWRKKIREEKLPPVLLWFIPSLDAYIILDGHSRYQASLLEDIKPDLIVINQVQKHIFDVDQNRVNQIIKSLEKNEKKISRTKLNNILINLYCKNVHYQSRFKSEAIYDFEKLWEVEVREVLDGYWELDDILGRRVPE